MGGAQANKQEGSDNFGVVVVEDPAFLRASELCSLVVVPLALKAAVGLRVLDILAATSPAPLSAADIASLMSSRYGLKGASVHALDRVLRLLASHGVLDVAHGPPTASAPPTSSSLTPTYSLNSISKYFLSYPEGVQEEAGVTTSIMPSAHSCKDASEGDKPSQMRATFAPMLAWQFHKANLEGWHHVEESIMDDSVAPFTRANGKAMYLHAQEDHIFGQQFNSAMAGLSKGIMASFLEAYQGFPSVKSLVDVGGGVGSCLESIVSKYPHIQGINFDQSHVVANAPHIKGVKHVGGNMFEAIPKAEALLLKAILHNWGDKESIQILKCCYEALPHGGKVILLENTLPRIVGPELASRVAYQIDFHMFLDHQHGRERTHQELQSLAQVAGFASAQLVGKLDGARVLELHKT